METVHVVGSGASGVNFAQTALAKGYRVVMVDAGRSRPVPVRPQDDFVGLKANLEDPAGYFLGSRFESLILPDYDAEYYGFPAHKQYIFSSPEEFRYRAAGFSPLVSFAAGGLAEAWTGGCYPFRDEELAAFPFGYRELGPYYGTVARRIGISGAEDDLARFFPVHDGLLPPLELDEHSAVLLSSYRKHRESLQDKLRCYIGRSRSATLSVDHNGRKACNYSGRCLWGCPDDAFYTPFITLRKCLSHPAFEYRSGLYVSHFRFSTGGRITRLAARAADTGQTVEFDIDKLVLAAGTLSSSLIFANSIYRDSGEVVTLGGLMDNRQILMPFVNLKMAGRPYRPGTYQYHQVAVGMDAGEPMDYIHGLVTTLKTAMIHPVVQTMPLDFGGAISLFRNLHAALGLVNINFSDSRRPGNCLTLEPNGSGPPRLVIQYAPDAREPERLKTAIQRFQKVLWKLGCVAPAGMTHLRPMGASVHYAGTIPMSGTAAPLTATPECRSHDFENLWFADGTTFPALPAKNLTFTLMANAVRIAEEAF
jgi:choline dehydrogenase-like flavoprotein